MSAFISVSLSLMCFLVCSCTGQEKITADLGQDVILLCKVPNKNNILAVEWNRPEMDPEYVLLYRDGRIDPFNQHPSYQNRVDLQDKEMKDGDVSMILKNVKMEDTGIYECRVFEKGKIELINIITLEVHLSGDKDGLIGDGGDMDEEEKDRFIVGPVVGMMLVLVGLGSVGFLMYRRHMRQNPESKRSS